MFIILDIFIIIRLILFQMYVHYFNKNNMDNNNTMMMYITLHVERASYNKGGMLEGLG